jgi:2-phosphosulfolactate phosphatase
MNAVDLYFTVAELDPAVVPDRTVVVVDVLRATSVTVEALANGARAVYPTTGSEEAIKLISSLGREDTVLCGERRGRKFEGYDLGNSPSEFTRERVEGRRLVMNTTNGTQALEQAKEADTLVAACFLNAGRVVDFIRRTADAVTIVCAGRQNRLALEDTLCAGLLLDRLWDGNEPYPVTDSAHTAYTLYHTDRDDLDNALRGANHAEWLTHQNREADLDYCFRIDALPVLPYYTENRLLLYEDTVSA